MSDWACGIVGCGAHFDAADELVRHQVAEHGTTACAVCGERQPEGFLAIRHAFTSHTRAEYVRAYDATSDDIRQRERALELVEDLVDVDTVLADLGVEAEEPAVSAGD